MNIIKRYKYILASVLIRAVGLICESILNEDAKTVQTRSTTLPKHTARFGTANDR